MGKALLAAYVATVLLVSANANAVSYQSPARVTDAALDTKTLDILVEGFLPNPCYRKPGATLEVDERLHNVLIVRLNSTIKNGGACIAKVKPFTDSISLPHLVRISGIEIQPLTEYSVKVKGLEFEARVSGVDLVNLINAL